MSKTTTSDSTTSNTATSNTVTSNTVNVDIQVLPLTDGDLYPIVDRAIDVIHASGMKYEVGPMGTTLEGDLDACMDVAKAAHRACFVDGVQRVVTIVKIGEAVGGSSIEEKIGKYRDNA